MPGACDLCGLPTAGHALSRRFDDGERAFCCLGCRNVYTILRESGILAPGVDPRETALFRESLRLGLIARRAEEAPPAIPADAEIKEAVYRVGGMWCGSCAWVIEQALTAERGVVSAEVMFASDLLRVRYAPQYLPPDRLPRRLAALGYRLEHPDAHHESEHSEFRDLLLRAGVAAFLWMNVMALSLVIYASYWEAISDSARHIVPLVLMALATPAVFYSAWPVLRLAALGARAGVLRVEALLALGILSAYGYSSVQAFTAGRHYYFDTACAIVTLVLAGKLLERGAKAKTARAIALLYGMMPRKARLVTGAGERFVAIEALAAGMEFVVQPGERIPADGVVEDGASHVDESVLTGESTPVRKGAGESVAAGSLNTAGVLRVRATRVAAESTLHQIVRAVDSAVSSRSRVERTVDRIARVFVPVLIAIAVLTVGGCLAAGIETSAAILRGIAVLVIACPCALGMATPLAITAAIGAASRRGILVRDSRVLETIAGIDTVVLDKTGTVTEGNFGVVETVPDLSAPAFAMAAAVERYSGHPLGRAVIRHLESRVPAIPRASNVTAREGMGISGTVEGIPVAIGSRRLMADAGARLLPEIEAAAAPWEQRGCTVAWIACGGEVAGAMALGDRVRPDAARLVRELRRRGIRTALISGDSQAATAAVAGAIGVEEYRAGVLPAEKVAAIRRFQRGGARVAMLGDGINDAPALAAADLGIALGSGTDLAMQAAPVVLMANSLERVIEAFDFSRAAFRAVRQNLFWAFAYNAAGIALAVTGVLSPIFAAAAMVLSSLSVIANSLRLHGDRRH